MEIPAKTETCPFLIQRNRRLLEVFSEIMDDLINYAQFTGVVFLYWKSRNESSTKRMSEKKDFEPQLPGNEREHSS